MAVDVVPDEVGHWVGRVTANDSGWENTTVRCNVVELNVRDGDQWLRCTSIITACKRVKHASWTATTWLLLLLGTDVDVPPDRVVAYDVGVCDIRNLTARAR